MSARAMSCGDHRWGRRRRQATGLCVAAIVLVALLTLFTSPVAAAPSYPDVSPMHPYYGAIDGLASRGIVSGYADGDFGPSDLVKRQQFAKMIVSTMGYTPTEDDWCSFPDVEHVPGRLYPFHFVAKAAATGLTTGYKDGTFGPGDPATRQQVITMVVRAGGSRLETPPADFAGVYYDGDLAHGRNIRVAEYNGLLAGLQGPPAQWDAERFATRGECAQMLWNLLLFLAEKRTFETVDVLTAYARLSTDPGAQLIDVREPAEWAETGVPVGAVLMPLGVVEERAPAVLARDRAVYALCKMGVRSQKAAETLVKLGFTEVYNVSGGILAWLSAGLPVETYTLPDGDGCGG